MRAYDALEGQVLRAVREEAGIYVATRVRLGLMKTAGVDSGIGLASLWESLCFYMQGQESVPFDLYRHDVMQQVIYHVAQLKDQRLALRLTTTEGFAAAADNDEPMVDRDVVSDAVLRDYVLPTADRWSNARIRVALELYC